MNDVQVGDRVAYLPAPCHWNATDARGERLFALHHHAPGRERHGRQLTPDETKPGAARFRRDPSDPPGVFRQGEAHDAPAVTVGRPLRPWPAAVLAVHEDGSADLSIEHPYGGLTHQEFRVPRDDAGAAHPSYRKAD